MPKVKVKRLSSAGPARVFISYSRHDFAVADALREALSAAGFEAFLDQKDIAPGEPWRERLGELIASAERVIFLLSPASVQSEICTWEVDAAERMGKPVLPVIVAETALGDIPGRLCRLNFIFHRTEEERERGRATLIQALRVDLAWEREKTRINDLATAWADAMRHDRLLIARDDRVREMEAWRDSHPSTSPPPTELQLEFITKSRRLVSRNQIKLVRGALVFSVLTIGLATLAWTQREAALENAEIAADQRRIAVENADRAKQNFLTAERALNSLVFDIVQNLKDVEGVSPTAIRRILGQAKQAADTLISRDPANAELQRLKAAAYGEFGDVYERSGLVDEARGAREESLAIYRTLAAADANDRTLQRDVGVALEKLGDLKLRQGQKEEARNNYRESLRILEPIVTHQPSDADASYSYGLVLSELGDLNADDGDFDAALKTYGNAADVFKALRVQDPVSRKYLSALAGARHRLGALHLRRGEPRKAAASYRELLNLSRTLAEGEPENTKYQRDLSIALTLWADRLLAVGRDRDAYERYWESLRIQRKLAEDEPNNTVFQYDISWTLAKIGDVLERFDDTHGMKLAYAETAEIRRDLIETEPNNLSYKLGLGAILLKIGDLHTRVRDAESAREAFEEGRLTLESAAALDPKNSVVQRNLFLAHRRLARFEPTLHWCEGMRVGDALAARGALEAADSEILATMRSECGRYLLPAEGAAASKRRSEARSPTPSPQANPTFVLP